MDVVGYADRLSVRQGEKIRFMVSSGVDTYKASLVRLQHGDLNPAGPGFKAHPIQSSVEGSYTGREQQLFSGSYVMIPNVPKWHVPESFSLQTWIYPTIPHKGTQDLLTQWNEHKNPGYRLFITEDGDLAFSIRDAEGRIDQIRTGAALEKSIWYFVACTFDRERRVAKIYQLPVTIWSGEVGVSVVERKLEVMGPFGSRSPFVIGAHSLSTNPGKGDIAGYFNGKIDSPRLFRRALTSDEIEALRVGVSPEKLDGPLVAAWDFSQKINSRFITDISGNEIHGWTVNMPTRAVTGYNWTGRETDFKQAPHEYGAIHFHDDDLEALTLIAEGFVLIEDQIESERG